MILWPVLFTGLAFFVYLYDQPKSLIIKIKKMKVKITFLLLFTALILSGQNIPARFHHFVFDRGDTVINMATDYLEMRVCGDVVFITELPPGLSGIIATSISDMSGKIYSELAILRMKTDYYEGQFGELFIEGNCAEFRPVKQRRELTPCEPNVNVRPKTKKAAPLKCESSLRLEQDGSATWTTADGCRTSILSISEVKPTPAFDAAKESKLGVFWTHSESSCLTCPLPTLDKKRIEQLKREYKNEH